MLQKDPNKRPTCRDIKHDTRDMRWNIGKEFRMIKNGMNEESKSFIKLYDAFWMEIFKRNPPSVTAYTFVALLRLLLLVKDIPEEKENFILSDKGVHSSLFALKPQGVLN